MPRPEPGKKYLIVFCKKCDKGFRVVDSALEPGKAPPRPKVLFNLKCRGCGHVDVYTPAEMRVASVERRGKRA